MRDKTIIVTGAAGFVGGQTALYLSDLGYSVVGIDDRACPEHLGPAVGVFYEFLQTDYASDAAFGAIQQHRPAAIVHCAGTSLVGPSVQNPELYYNNNFAKTKQLLDFIVKTAPGTRVIFSSSSSVYGEPVRLPCEETDLPAPVSPYGESKRMIEMMLASYAQAYQLDYVAFRYFNVCGADPQGRHGQPSGATHIIARVLESIRDRKSFDLFGTDYPTADGTCVRDHVHVNDVAAAHEAAINPKFNPGIYNVGIEHGASNLEVIDAAQEVTGHSLSVNHAPRRPGDPSQLIATNKKLCAQGWEPKYNLQDMVAHAWAWYSRP